MPERANLYRGHRLPAEVIAHAVRRYLRFALSFRDVEELLAERGVEVSYETVRRWVAKFGPQYANELRRRAARPGRTWHLDRVGGPPGVPVNLGLLALMLTGLALSVQQHGPPARAAVGQPTGAT